MADAVELTITRAGNRVTIVGDIRTPADRELLRECFAELAGEELVLDVEQAGYLDTTTLAVLVTIARKCLDVGMTLALEGANEDLVKQLQVTHIDEVLQHHGARITPARGAA